LQDRGVDVTRAGSLGTREPSPVTVRCSSAAPRAAALRRCTASCSPTDRCRAPGPTELGPGSFCRQRRQKYRGVIRPCCRRARPLERHARGLLRPPNDWH
jgi:hypothetical protein